MLRLVALFTTLVLVAAACSKGEDSSLVASLTDDDGTTQASSAESDDVDPEEAMIALTACLREQGVDVEDPTVDADGNVQPGQIRDLDQGEGGPGGPLAAAFEACADEAEGVRPGFAAGDDTVFRDTLLEFAQCMRENGYDVPDPDFSNSGPGGGAGEGEGDSAGPGGGPFGSIDRDDPAFQTAQAACEDILAGFGPGGGRIGGGPGGANDDG